MDNYLWIKPADTSSVAGIVETGTPIQFFGASGSTLYIARTETYAKIAAWDNGRYIKYVVAHAWDAEKGYTYVGRANTSITWWYCNSYGLSGIPYWKNKLWFGETMITSSYSQGHHPGIVLHASELEAIQSMDDGNWTGGPLQPVGVSIPVQWKSKYREEPYEASFEIQVT